MGRQVKELHDVEPTGASLDGGQALLRPPELESQGSLGQAHLLPSSAEPLHEPSVLG